MTLEELKSLQPGDVVVITKVDRHLNNDTTSKDYYLGEEMTFLSCDRCYDFLRHSKVDKPGLTVFHLQYHRSGTISHFAHGVSDYIERKVKLVRERKLTDLGI